MRVLKRCVLRVQDWARTANLSRIKSVFLRIFARFLAPEKLVNARVLYLVAWHPARGRRVLVKKTIALAGTRNKLVDSTQIATSILLKSSVSADERGVLLVSFEPQLSKLVALKDFPELEKRYAIVFVPTWQPFDSEAIFVLAARAQRPFWVMPSSTADQSLCADLGRLCRPLPFQASSWASYAQYADTRAAKRVDLLMLANFSSYKRHWRLFEAARDLPVSLRIVVAGRPCFGRTAESLLEEADAFGVRDRIELVEDPSDEEVARLLASARVFCGLSHKEGSYIAIAEALLADTAVAMFADAVVGSKEYIGPATGWLLEPKQPLAPQLLRCLQQVDERRPREWAKTNISAEANNPRFNELMRQDAMQLGEQWTVDLARFYCRHFEFEYFDRTAQARFGEEYQLLSDRFGLTVRRPNFDRELVAQSHAEAIPTLASDLFASPPSNAKPAQ
jgi:glycosyltransferase involved in cell wall biosynthesis